MKTPNRGPWFIVLTALLWGTIGLSAQLIYNVADIGALALIFYRLLIAIPVLSLALAGTLGRHALAFRRADLGAMALMGAAFALFQLGYFSAIARTGVAVATLITICSAPVLVALLSALVLRERLSRRVLTSLVLAVIGTALLVDIQPATLALEGQRTLGYLLALGAALSYALMVLSSRRLAAHYHPLQTTTFAFTLGALVLLPFSLSAGLNVQLSPSAWALLLYLGLVPTALGYVLFFIGMRTTQATAASIITLLEPLTATLLAWLLLGEKLGIWGVLGGALLLTAIVRLSAKPKES